MRLLRTPVGLILALTWLLAIVISYTIVHNPFNASIAAALLKAARDVIAVTTLVTLGGALGRLLIGEPDALTHLEKAALQALLGLGVLSVGVLVSGLIGFFPPNWPAWLITLGLLGALHRSALAWGRDLLAGLQEAFSAQPDDTLTRWVRRGVVVLLALTALPILAPPGKWDAMTYHLVGPGLYLNAGRIVSFPDNHFLGFPQLVEMLYLWLMILARPHSAALLHGCAGLLLLLTCLGTATRLGKPAVGWLAAAVLLVSDSFWGEFHWPYNDLFLAAYTFGALTMLFAWRESSKGSFLIWAGVFTGFMMGTKYSASSFTIGIGVLSVWLARRDGLLSMLRTAAVVTVVAVIAFAPWAIKNVLMDGNPFSPFWFGTRAFDTLDQWYYLRPGTGLDIASLILLPLEATVFGEEWLIPYGVSTGALLVGLLPLTAVGWKGCSPAERAWVQGGLSFCLPAYGLWLYGAGVSVWLGQVRLLYPAFPVLAMMGAIGLIGFRKPPSLRPFSRLIEGVTLAVIGIALIDSGLIVVKNDPLPVTLGLESEEEYLLDQLQAYYAAMQAVNRLPKEAQILFLWEPRSYYCERRCYPDSLTNTWWRERQDESDPARIAAGWRKRGFTHVLVFEAGLRFFYEEEPYSPLSDEDVAAFDALRGRELIAIENIGGAYTLYELRGELP